MPAGLVMTFLEGLASFVSPCSLPLLPVYVSYFTAGDAPEGKKGRARVFFRSLFFALGFTVVFCLMGALAGSLGSVLARHAKTFRIVCGALVVLFGLSCVGLFEMPSLGRSKSVGRAVTTLPAAFAFGCAYAVSLTPCIGIFLASALALAGASATVVSGLLLLVSYSLGLAVPFIASAVAIDVFKGLFATIRRRQRTVNAICGTLLIIMGVLIALGYGGMSWRGRFLSAFSFPKGGSATADQDFGAQPDGAEGAPDASDADEVPVSSVVSQRRMERIEKRRIGKMNEVELTKENFQKEALESDLPVLVDFWAAWCGPCRMLSPIISEIASEHSDKIKVGKVNVDEQPDLAAQYGISSIPAVFLLKDGKAVKSFVGARSKGAVVDFISEYLK